MKPRILVVDDDEAITQQLYWTLSDEYDVITANDVKTAIRRATFYKPDISILDLQMPPSENTPLMGLQLLEFIKGHFPNSRVLIMSSNDESEVQKACYEAGADEFFDKPFEVEEMLATICRLSPVHKIELIAKFFEVFDRYPLCDRFHAPEMTPTSSEGALRPQHPSPSPVVEALFLTGNVHRQNFISTIPALNGLPSAH
jgi:CheY-like chemotaxis protein